MKTLNQILKKLLKILLLKSYLSTPSPAKDVLSPKSSSNISPAFSEAKSCSTSLKTKQRFYRCIYVFSNYISTNLIIFCSLTLPCTVRNSKQRSCNQRVCCLLCIMASIYDLLDGSVDLSKVRGSGPFLW